MSVYHNVHQCVLSELNPSYSLFIFQNCKCFVHELMYMWFGHSSWTYQLWWSQMQWMGTFVSTPPRILFYFRFILVLLFTIPPTLENLQGHFAFGLSVHPSYRQSICPSVRASIQNLLRYSFEISYVDSSSKNNWHAFFFKSGLSPFVQ